MSEALRKIIDLGGMCEVCGKSGLLRINFYDRDGCYRLCRFCNIELGHLLGTGFMADAVLLMRQLRMIGFTLIIRKRGQT